MYMYTAHDRNMYSLSISAAVTGLDVYYVSSANPYDFKGQCLGRSKKTIMDSFPYKFNY